MQRTKLRLLIHLRRCKNAYDRFGLTFNVQKTKVLAQPAPKTDVPEFNITISDSPPKQVDHFPYLGSLLSTQRNCEKDVENRIRAAHVAFGKLSPRVFRN